MLTGGDPMVFIRIFCLMPYFPDGHTDPMARASWRRLSTG